jgi:hypothetical protein
LGNTAIKELKDDILLNIEDKIVKVQLEDDINKDI